MTGQIICCVEVPVSSLATRANCGKHFTKMVNGHVVDKASMQCYFSYKD